MSQDMIQQLAKRIADDIIKQAGKQISPTEPLISSGLIDSFSLVDLSLMVEDDFDVQIDDTELNAETFDTLEELAALIKSRQ